MAALRLLRRRLLLALAVVIAALGGMRTLAGQQTPLEYHWVGRIDWSALYTVSQGSTRHTYGFDVTWKERQIDVTHNSRVVGQVTVLEDATTRWDGVLSGLVKNEVMTQMISGKNSGSGQPVQGWIYRSIAADDPLKAFDGAYGFASAGAGAKIDGTLVSTSELFGTYTAPYPSGMQFHAGGSVLYPGGTAPMTADAVRSLIERGRTLAQQVAAVDRTPRTLQSGGMTGSYAYAHPPGGLNLTMTWNIQHRLNITGTLTEAPAEWRPIAIDGAPAEFTASLDPSLGLKGRFRFTLFDVSREPGWATNKGTGTGLDLKFSDDQPVAHEKPVETGDGWTIETTDASATATIHVTARDYGAWGQLKAEVQIDGQWYECKPASGNAVRLPFDRNDNHMADSWERDLGLSHVDADGDVDTGAGPNVGDGFSNYEEYRGFYVRGTWTTLDPTIKELFVVDKAGIGTGSFASSGVTPLRIRSDEWNDTTRVVNFNRHYASAGAQKGVRMVTTGLDPGILGEAFPRVGTPNQVTEVRLDLNQIARMGPGALAGTIAHELGHAVNVQHHGEYEFNSCGRGSDLRLIALWNGAHGGDRQCVMSYSGANFYKRSDRVCRDYTWPNLFGGTFCRSKAGTDINGGDERLDESGHPMPVSGDARRGDCVSQIRLK